MHNEIVEKLFKEYILNGYITEQQVFAAIDENNIPLFEVEYICDQLLSKGVIIRDDDDYQAAEQDDYDRSQTDYAAIYESVLNTDPYLLDFIEYVRNIQPPRNREWQNLLPQAQNGNDYARTRVFEMYIRVVIKTALVLSQKYGLELADTIQDGLIGLHTAIDKFEFGRQDSFVTYFPFWVMQIIMREAETRNPTVYFPFHVKEKLFNIYDTIDAHDCDLCGDSDPCLQLIHEIAEKLDCSLEEASRFYHYTIPFQSIEQLLEENEYAFSDHSQFEDTIITNTENQFLYDNVRKIIRDRLTDREYDVISYRYGINDRDVHTLEMLGEKMGITRERVRQIEASALKKLARCRNLKRRRN